ncbi:MAG: glutamine synthetase [Chloroflexi bacterium]|nr:glutamine synthetase [Chloroflexota bacterium]
MTAPLTFIATCDLVALTRGRSMRTDDYPMRRTAGVGWVPADLALTTFGDIASPNPFGSLGDLRLVPDDAARITLPAIAGRPETDVVLACIAEEDGRAWRCDPRTALVDALATLDEAGLRLVASFEQEFTLSGPALEPRGAPPFSLEAHRAAEPFGTELVHALQTQALAPETWLPEYGDGQYEITLAATDGLAAADRAILVRALVRDLAAARGLRRSFAPLVAPDAVGNGVHIHLSLWDRAGRPVTLDPSGALTGPAGSFAAGVVAHAPGILAWAAPSVISSLRFGPHHWSSAAAFVGRQNREAMLRICPMPTLGGGDPLRAANLEFRACDATANPWLALAAIVRAGVDGLREELPAPHVLEGELEDVPEHERARLGIVPLPGDLESALAALEADEVACGWFDPDLLATHVAIRRTELELLRDVSPAERCERYARVI